MTIIGNVEKFVSISPKVVRLTGPVGKEIKLDVKIVPQKKYPFKIIESKAQAGDNIDFKLIEAKKPNEDGYLLTIENKRKIKGRYFDTIFLKTSSEIKPNIKINIYGNIFEPSKEQSRNRSPNT